MENAWWLNYSDELQSYFENGETHHFYDSLKTVCGPLEKSRTPVRAANGDLLKDKSRILGRWAEHFANLLNRVNPTDPRFAADIPQLDMVDELDRPPALSEVVRAIPAIKCRKAPGMDGLQGELLKYGGNRAAEQIHKFICACWDIGDVPS